MPLTVEPPAAPDALDAAPAEAAGIAAKADVNARTLRGDTALSVAASDGREDIARLLIDNGANVNDADINGCTALYWARTRGHERIEELLRQHGGLEPCAKPESLSR